MTRCTGHCCKAFCLPFSPQALRARLDEDRAGEKARGEVDGSSGLWDEEQIYAMIVYLGEFTPLEAMTKFCTRVPDGNEEPSGHYYTCNNLAADGNCSIYEARPHMCRDYPYGEPCRYQKCTAEHRGEHFEQSKKRRLSLFIGDKVPSDG